MKRSLLIIVLFALAMTGCADNGTISGSAPVSAETVEAVTSEVTSAASLSQTAATEQTTPQESDKEQSSPETTVQTTTSVTTQQTSASSTTVQTTATSVPTAQTTAQTTVVTTAPIEVPPSTPETWEYYTSEEAYTDEQYYTEESYIEEPAEGDIYEPVIDVPVYSDSNLGDYVLLTVVPEKIYWNELDYFHPTEGEEFTMLFPAFFYETFKESDSVVLRFDPIKSSYTHIENTLKAQCGGCDFIYSYVRPSDSWQKDMLFSIKDGALTRLDCEKYIKTYFNNYEAGSWVMRDHKDELYYGMTVDEVDAFMAAQHAECVEADEYWNKIIEEDPNNAVDFEMSHSYFTYGMVMRVKLADDGNTSDTETNKTAVYDDVFRGASGSATGAPMTYEDVMSMIASGEKHGEYLDSLYLVETVKALTAEECAKLDGWDITYSDRTIYEVNIIEDLISGEAVGRKEYIFVSMGNAQWQNKGDPIYAPGEKFTVALTKPQQGCDFLRTPGSFMFRYDVVEDASGNITLYSRNSAMDDLNLPNAVAIEKTVITSTTKNPAIYTCKIPLDDMTEYLREDWSARGIR